MPIKRSFCLACCILLGVPFGLLGADPPAAKDPNSLRLALLRAVPVKWDLICDIDLSQAKDDNHLRDRRPEIYQLITEDK